MCLVGFNGILQCVNGNVFDRNIPHFDPKITKILETDIGETPFSVAWISKSGQINPISITFSPELRLAIIDYLVNKEMRNTLKGVGTEPPIKEWIKRDIKDALQDYKENLPHKNQQHLPIEMILKYSHSLSIKPNKHGTVLITFRPR